MVKYGVDISNIGRNLYYIQLYHWRDKQRILDGQPWHFDKYLILLVEIDSAVKPLDLNLFHLPIWARFYDIPFKGRGNDDNERVLGNKIGVFLEVVKSTRGSFEKSMRIKVNIDVREPLKDSVSLKVRGVHICSIPVKYEPLPMICLYCGRLGHGFNKCVVY